MSRLCEQGEREVCASTTQSYMYNGVGCWRTLLVQALWKWEVYQVLLNKCLHGSLCWLALGFVWTCKSYSFGIFTILHLCSIHDTRLAFVNVIFLCAVGRWNLAWRSSVVYQLLVFLLASCIYRVGSKKLSISNKCMVVPGDVTQFLVTFEDQTCSYSVAGSNWRAVHWNACEMHNHLVVVLSNATEKAYLIYICLLYYVVGRIFIQWACSLLNLFSCNITNYIGNSKCQLSVWQNFIKFFKKIIRMMSVRLNKDV